MLYLEDYLEMIEHLPQELRDRFTEMREMDLSVQNIMDTLEKRSKVFFSQCRRNEIQSSAAENEFENLKKDYYKVLEDADEKVSLASTMHELVERYLRRLDSELFKFKCELEADNNGITEVLEKRSLELDGNNSIQNLLTQKENRYFGAIGNNSLSQLQKDKLYRPKPEKRRDSTNAPVIEKRPNLSNNIVATQTNLTTIQPVRSITPNVNLHGGVLNNLPATPSMNYNAQHVNAGNNQTLTGTVAIVTPNQSNISTPQQLQQNRRTTIHGNSLNDGNHDLLVNREINITTHVIAGIDRDQAILNNQRRHKKKLSSSLTHTSVPNSSISTSTIQSLPHSSNLNSTVIDPNASRVNENGMVVEQTADGEWTYDPNEPRYCICNQVSYGDMVACDNEACPFEWFHYPCVGITQSPKGKWYCPKCTLSMRRRNRKN